MSQTTRFLSYLDVLGFSELIDAGELDDVKARLNAALSIVPYGLSLGNFPGPAHLPTLPTPRLHFSAFSDTYLIWSEDDSVSAFFGIVIATALVSANMFACELGVRGAITCGEAECIPGSGQLVGRAVTRASKLEKQQDWFGVIIDPDILTVDRRAILDLIFVKPLVVEYEVPLKKNAVISAPCLAINWRFNMSVEKGIASLFRESEDAASKNKRDATLAFCRWLRDNNLATGAVYGHDGNPIKIPWLKGLHVGRHQPGTEQAIHGDAF